MKKNHVPLSKAVVPILKGDAATSLLNTLENAKIKPWTKEQEEQTIINMEKVIERRKMKELKNWKEVTKGIFRYVISTNVAYEIHIITWYHDTDILTAKSSLYIVGEWKDKEHGSLTEREC